MGRRGRRTKEMVSTATERIDTLLDLAREEAGKGNIEFSHRYVDHAIKIGMRYNVRIPPSHRRELCRKCRSYLLPGRTSRVRLTTGKISSTCLRCGHLKRYPYGTRMERHMEDTRVE